MDRSTDLKKSAAPVRKKMFRVLFIFSNLAIFEQSEFRENMVKTNVEKVIIWST